MQHVLDFMKKDLVLPEALVSTENTVKMLTLLFPCSIKSNRQQDEFTRDRNLFSNIFKENNNCLRNTFFRDPFVKHLWGSIFVSECAEVSKQHLRKIRSQPNQGEVKFMRLFKHMLQLEEQFNLKMLPACARNPHNLKVFNKDEEIEYMVQNSKYNKRQNRDKLEMLSKRESAKNSSGEQEVRAPS